MNGKTLSAIATVILVPAVVLVLFAWTRIAADFRLPRRHCDHVAGNPA
jgi:hypothetical protein